MKKYFVLFSIILILSLLLSSCLKRPAVTSTPIPIQTDTPIADSTEVVAVQNLAPLSPLSPMAAIDMIEDATPDQVYLIQPEPFFIYSSTEDPFIDPSDRSLCVPFGSDVSEYMSQYIYDFQIVTQKIFQGDTLKSFEVNFVNFDVDENNNVFIEDRTTMFPDENETQETNYWFCRGDVPPIPRDMAYQMKDKYPDATVKFAGFTITPKTETIKFNLSFCFNTEILEGNVCPEDKNLDASHLWEDYMIYISTSGLGSVSADGRGMAIFEARIIPEDVEYFASGIQIDQHIFWGGGGGDGIQSTITSIDGNTVNISIMP